MLVTASGATAAPAVERRRRLSPAALAVANRKVRPAYSPVVITGAVRLADFILLSSIGLGLYLGYVARTDGIRWDLVATVLAMAGAAVICFQASDLYQIQVFRGQLRQVTRMMSAWAFVFMLCTAASFLAKSGGEISRFWLSAFFVMGLGALVLERLCLRALVRRWARQGRLDRRTIIVGSDRNGEELVEALKVQDDSDIEILGVFDDRNDSRALDTCAGSPKLGKVDDIIEFARRTRVDLVLFALPISAETRILDMLQKLWVLPVDIRLSAHTNKLRFRPRSYSYVGKIPTLDVFEAPITDWDLVMKWLFDHVVGAALLLLALPAMALIAIAIKLDSPGPVLFRQKRFGFNNERIDVFKFRSLYHDQADPLASKVVTKNDSRALDTCAGSPKLGKVDDIIEFARRTRVDLVLFALPISAETRILDMLKKLWVLPVDIRLSAHTNKLRFRPRSYSYVGKIPTLDVFEAPITDWDLVMKWLFDHVVGAAVLLLALPAMALIALAIKIDSPGPVLFRQKRFGFNNERIDVFKFRSLFHDQADPLASKVVTKNDSRVTRVGRFIRKTSLDELPQLFNVVFKSNLSLVGPRPHAVQGKFQSRLFDEAVDGYFARHRVKPGITGWAQINGWRGEVDSEEKIQKRVEFDLYYIENWSVLFDLYILLKTPLALITKHDNAY